MSIPISQFITPPPPPLGSHTLALYVCVPISALQISSPVAFRVFKEQTPLLLKGCLLISLWSIRDSIRKLHVRTKGKAAAALVDTAVSTGQKAVQLSCERRPTHVLGIHGRDKARCGQQLSGQVLRWKRNISGGKSKGKNWSNFQPSIPPTLNTLRSSWEAVGWWVRALLVSVDTTPWLWGNLCAFGRVRRKDTSLWKALRHRKLWVLSKKQLEKAPIPSGDQKNLPLHGPNSC